MADPSESATLQKAVIVLQAQRNQVLDTLTNSDIRIALLVDENAALKAQIEELKKATEPPKEPAEPQ